MINYTAPAETTVVKANLTLNGTPIDASPYTLTAGQNNGKNRLHSVTPALANGDPLADGLYLFSIEEDDELQPGYYPYKIVNGVEVPVDGLADSDRAQLSTLATSATEERLVKLDTVATTATAGEYKATAAELGLDAIAAAIGQISTDTLESGDVNAIAAAVKTALDAQLLELKELGEGDIEKTLNTYNKFRRGTTEPLFPQKTISATGDLVSIREV